MGFWFFSANEKWVEKLPQDLKTIVIEAAQRMTWNEMERAEFRYLQLLNKFRENGVKITELNDTEIEKMKKMWLEYKDKFVEQIGKDYYEKVETLIESD